MKKTNRSRSILTIVLPSLFLSLAAGCLIPPHLVFRNDPGEILFDSTKTILVLPVDTVIVEYKDNTKIVPDSQFTDSLFLEAANALLKFEAGKLFPAYKAPDESYDDSTATPERFPLSASRIKGDTAKLDSVSECVRAAAAKYSVDLVLIPYSMVIKHTTFQPGSMRSRTGPGYEKPVSYNAFGTTHIQVWSKNGTLMYERIGKSDAGRPVLYTLFEKDAPEGDDYASFARHLYAPPLIRVLYMSLKDALRIRR